MRTNPLLARREIPRKERLQKALIAVVFTALIVAAAWFSTDDSLHRSLAYLSAVGSVGILGLSAALFLWLKKNEVAKTKEDSQHIKERIEDDRHGRGWVDRIGFNIRRFLAGIVVLTGGLFVLAGIGVFGLQAYGYLRYGDWVSRPFFDLILPYIPWLRAPESWFGLHRIVREVFDFLPVSLLLLLLGWLIAGFGSALRGRVRR